MPRLHRNFRLTPIAAALLCAGSGTALAQDAQRLPEVRVTAPAGADYQVEQTSSPKSTAPLVDTPQTIQVIPSEVFIEQGARNLTEVLRNTPGITFNAGENGFGTTSNNFSLRGFDTSGNIFIDGVRDSGNYTRDAFNLEQVEVVKGPAADNGRGGAGGYVNLVTKAPKYRQDFITGTIGYGFDRYDSDARRRASADINRTLGDAAAFRLNLMVEDSGIAGRDVAEQSGFGIAPSLALKLGAATDLTLSYQHLRTDDRPDWGVPAAMIPGMLNRDPSIGKSNRDKFYGLRSDFDEVKSDALLARIEHRISPSASISNQTRWSSTDREALYTVPTGYAPATQLVTTQRQAYTRENTSLSNLTNLDLRFATGTLKHHMAVGLELSQEESEAGRYPTNIPSNPGTVDIFAPDPNRPMAPFTGLVPTQTAKVKIDTIAVYAHDTIEIDPRWQVTGGLRLERYKVRIDSRTAAGAPQGPDGFERSEVTIGGKVGLVYKPAANGSIYVAYGESALPPGSFLSNPDISRTDDNAFPGWQGQNHQDSKEQRSSNIEIGTKWDLFDRRLSTTAAYFHTERRNIAMGPGVVPVGYGKQQVQGIELSAAGAVTRDWSIFGGLLLMDSKRTHSAAVDAALSADYGTYSTTIGDELAFTPKVTANLWTSYRVDPAITVAGGIQHVGSSWLGRPDTADRVIPNGRFGKLPSFTVVNLMASYAMNRNLTLRLNIDNVFDKLYATSANWPGTRVLLGAPRTFLVSADMKF
jgi:catecholate siderophore receptor